MILEIKNIVKRFGENEILKGVSIGVDKGETVAVIGPSGSGKAPFCAARPLLKGPTAAKYSITAKRL